MMAVIYSNVPVTHGIQKFTPALAHCHIKKTTN